MRILVTGGTGFIGSHLVDALSEKNDVIIFDNLSMRPGYVNDSAKLVQGDVRDRGKLVSTVKEADVVYHQAAVVGAGQSMYEVKNYVDINTLGTANLLDVLVNEEHSVKKLIVASSMTVYGEGAYSCESCGEVYPPERSPGQLKKKMWDPLCPNCGRAVKPVPTREETPLRPRSLYGLTKKNQEEMAMLIGEAYGIPTVVLRYNAVYGPRLRISSPYTGVGTVFVSRVNNNKPPIVFEDGLQTRDFVHVKDVIQANLLALQSKADYQVFNVGSGVATTILDLANIVIRLSRKKISPVVTGKYRTHDTRHFVADTSKIKKLGYSPKVAIKEAMKETMMWVNIQSQKVEDRFEQAYEEYEKKGLIS